VVTLTVCGESSDVLDDVLPCDAKVLVLIRSYDHDVAHETSSVEDPQWPLDRTGAAVASMPQTGSTRPSGLLYRSFNTLNRFDAAVWTLLS